jgi:antitoxin component YwqK of YwqJK toxin-antitoxin module
MTTDPTKIEYYENGQIKSKSWYKNGKYQSWRVNGEYHNENGPAYINYYENGKIRYQLWYINGNLHNENGPANIWYYKNGKIKSQLWCINGNNHNENGPAFIDYYANGQIKYQSWLINGKHLSDPEIIIQKELIEKRKIAINVISTNWLISKWNGNYREFLTQVLTVPENHDSLVGKLFPNGGYDYKKFKESLFTF